MSTGLAITPYEVQLTIKSFVTRVIVQKKSHKNIKKSREKSKMTKSGEKKIEKKN